MCLPLAHERTAVTGRHQSKNEDTMALLATRSAGMTVLAIYQIVVGVTGLASLAVPLAATAVLALLAGVLILLGR
jgi:hypothetical protein